MRGFRPLIAKVIDREADSGDIPAPPNKVAERRECNNVMGNYRLFIKKVVPMKVLDYIPNDAEIGVGLALQLRTREYVFFLPGERHIRDQMKKELFYAGIGGHLEPEESLLECGRRESREEIGMDINYETSHRTVYIDTNKVICQINVEDDVKPLAIYEMIHPIGSPKAGGTYHIVIYKALIDAEPHCFQLEEVSGIILLNQEQVMSGNRRASIHQLLEEGAKVIGMELDRDTVLYPIGTADALTLIKEGL